MEKDLENQILALGRNSAHGSACWEKAGRLRGPVKSEAHGPAKADTRPGPIDGPTR
jgi:hypothetical protein